MSELTDVLRLVPIGDIATKLGVDHDVAESAVKQVLPGLLGGLAANASHPDGSASLTKALSKHVGASTKLDEIDTADGQKIVANVFGSNTDEVASKLAEGEPKPNVTAEIIKQVLPIVAPIVLSYLATKLLAPQQATAGSAPEKSTPAVSAGGIDLGGMLGGLLSEPNAQKVVGGLLGGLLGGGKK